MKVMKCRVCRGLGRVRDSLFNEKPCPTCGGIGEFEIQIDPKRAIRCKYCKGTGKIGELYFTVSTCPVCKGLGIVERPRVAFAGSSNEIIYSRNVPRPSSFKYEIAISFAGEDRQIAESYATKLKNHNVTVFFDDFEKVDLWGKDLYEQLDNVYRKQARYCVIFLSSHYAEKLWTNHERKSAQSRAFQENSEYILPVRLDDTEIPGIRETVGYIDLRKISLEELFDITLKKLAKK